MFNRVLFVCVGNICRSPLAEYWAREQLTKAGHSVMCSSAGLSALVDRPMEPHSLAILAEQGIDGAAHRARKIDAKIVNDADLIFTMEDWQTDDLLLAFPGARGKVFRLGHWVASDIADPYKQARDAFDAIFEQIEDYWSAWQAKLWEN